MNEKELNIKLNRRINVLNNDVKKLVQQLQQAGVTQWIDIPNIPPVNMLQSRWRIIKNFLTLIGVIVGGFFLLQNYHFLYDEAAKVRFFKMLQGVMKTVLQICKLVGNLRPEIKGTVTGALSTLSFNRLWRILTSKNCSVLKFNKDNLIMMGKPIVMGMYGNFTGTAGSTINFLLQVLDKTTKQNNAALKRMLLSLNRASGGGLTSSYYKLVDDILSQAIITAVVMVYVAGKELSQNVFGGKTPLLKSKIIRGKPQLRLQLPKNNVLKSRNN